MFLNFICILTALVFAGVSPPSLHYLNVQEVVAKQQHVNIVVRPRDSRPSDIPRTPSAVRIEAYYDEEISSVCSYLSNAGTVIAVSVSNLDTGETVSSSIPGSGFSVIPISGTTGTWILMYTLLSGKVYEGTFIL